MCLYPYYSGSLIIERSMESDAGRYECVAENRIGVAYSYAAMLYVKGKGNNLLLLTCFCIHML